MPTTIKYLDNNGLSYFWDKIDAKKQNKLTAGSNITIAADNTISATQPTVGNATLTIQKNGTSAGTFTANATSNKTINITVPTKTSDITNDSNFVASGDLATVATSGSYNDLANKPTVPEIKKRTGATTTTNITPLYVAGDGTTTPMALKTHGDDHTGSFAYVNINEPTSDISEAYIGGYVWDEYEEWWRKMSEKKLALYSDIPTVNNATLTIQKNGTTVKTFTANASSNVTANITVPTKTSELTNNSGFLTSSTGVTSVNGAHGAVTGIQTTSNLVTSVSSSSTNSQYPSAKLFYDTVGNVESVLQTLNSGTGVQAWYNKNMINFAKKKNCSTCNDQKADGHASPAVLQINNPSECVIFHKTTIPASMGNETTIPPVNGAYKNMLVYYEGSGAVYLYSSDGIPTLINYTDYVRLINKPSINGVTLVGNKSLADLGFVVDAEFSETSTNPVQNKVIYAAIGDVESILNTLNIGAGV